MTVPVKREAKISLQYKSDAFEALHSSASALHAIGAIPKATMRQFDSMSLTQIPQFDAAKIKKLRETQHVSQPLFARYLNTSESTVQKWENGAKLPSGMALKLLAMVEKHGLTVLA